MQPFRNIRALALLTAVMMPAAFAQYASPVKVTNATDSPMPTRDTRQTSSAIVDFKMGDTSVIKILGIPTCPNGTEFLTTSVTASPGLFSNYPPGAWGIEVDMKQTTPNGTNNYPLTAYGTGAQTASATLPAGQPSFSVGTTSVELRLITGPAPNAIFFLVHISGYCGVAFVSPVAQ